MYYLAGAIATIVVYLFESGFLRLTLPYEPNTQTHQINRTLIEHFSKSDDLISEEVE